MALADDGVITLVAVVEQIPSYVAEYMTVNPGNELEEGIRIRLRTIAEPTLPDTALRTNIRVPRFGQKPDKIKIGFAKGFCPNAY
ncbi:hypothetical protein [Aliiroseovarius sp. YM-037]|uniref:hypothetical protein n=1 Tax=Aliiroseovarius sp. YM-037 TaxID=3341728 RepID=UPI003A804B71